ELIDVEESLRGCEDAEIAKLIDERVPVPVLQGIVESVVPRIEQHVYSDDRQFDGDHRRQQNATRPFVLRAEIGTGEPPDCCQRREVTFHEYSPVSIVAGIAANPKYPPNWRRTSSGSTRAPMRASPRHICFGRPIIRDPKP